PGQDDALEALQAATEHQGMPLRVLDVSGVKDLPAEYQHPLLMVRADAHTVWRGHRLDVASAQALVATLCGRKAIS
ncbi:MAG: monooxygenase, partial [Bacteroidota bacterium]|nr:monooxygenase [Bacteroidota bacterium]